LELDSLPGAVFFELLVVLDILLVAYLPQMRRFCERSRRREVKSLSVLNNKSTKAWPEVDGGGNISPTKIVAMLLNPFSHLVCYLAYPYLTIKGSILHAMI